MVQKWVIYFRKNKLPIWGPKYDQKRYKILQLNGPFNFLVQNEFVVKIIKTGYF